MSSPGRGLRRPRRAGAVFRSRRRAPGVVSELGTAGVAGLGAGAAGCVGAVCGRGCCSALCSAGRRLSRCCRAGPRRSVAARAPAACPWSPGESVGWSACRRCRRRTSPDGGSPGSARGVRLLVSGALARRAPRSIALLCQHCPARWSTSAALAARGSACLTSAASRERVRVIHHNRLHEVACRRPPPSRFGATTNLTPELHVG